MWEPRDTYSLGPNGDDGIDHDSNDQKTEKESGGEEEGFVVAHGPAEVVEQVEKTIWKAGEESPKGARKQEEQTAEELLKW